MIREKFRFSLLAPAQGGLCAPWEVLVNPIECDTKAAKKKDTLPNFGPFAPPSHRSTYIIIVSGQSPIKLDDKAKGVGLCQLNMPYGSTMIHVFFRG